MVLDGLLAINGNSNRCGNHPIIVAMVLVATVVAEVAVAAIANSCGSCG